MEITNKPVHDPVADMYLVDAYMRWALLAAEEVVGKNGLSIVLRQAGLAHLINNYPPEQLKVVTGLRFQQYADLNAGLINFFGRSAKSMIIRIGRKSAHYAIEHQGPLFGTAALLAAKVLPLPRQISMGLTAMQLGLRRLSQAVGQDRRMRIDDRGEALAYITEDCAFCAGKQADQPICWVHTGSIQELLHWQTGKEFEIEQTECRALGAPACVWLINKNPKSAV